MESTPQTQASIMQWAFEASQRAASPAEMQQAVAQLPLLAYANFIATIE